MKIYTFVLLLGAQVIWAQQVDTLHVGKSFKDYKKLNFETFDFEVYSERDGKKTPAVKMTSVTAKKKVNGQSYVTIQHTWTSPKFSGHFNALVEPKTFRPVIQIRNNNGKKEAYRFSDAKISGLDTAANNAAADYHLDLPFPVFNFEIDLATFSILPLERDKVFMIPFFHAGSQSEPDYYKLTVEGTETVLIPGKGEVACWVLFMDYHGKQPTRFWYTQKGRQFVKMEATYGKAKIYKVRKF